VLLQTNTKQKVAIIVIYCLFIRKGEIAENASF